MLMRRYGLPTCSSPYPRLLLKNGKRKLVNKLSFMVNLSYKSWWWDFLFCFCSLRIVFSFYHRSISLSKECVKNHNNKHNNNAPSEIDSCDLHNNENRLRLRLRTSSIELAVKNTALNMRMLYFGIRIKLNI